MVIAEKPFEVAWIRQNSRNGQKMINHLQRVADWRHRTRLGGSSPKYTDFFHSCYGNPDSDIMFVAEIANLPSIDDLIKDVPPDELWGIPWYGKGGPPQILRDGLMANGLIPPFCEHKPSHWRCWVTNFVKVPESNSKWHGKGKEWNEMSKSEKESFSRMKKEIIEKSSEFLEEEIAIINPKCIVGIGGYVRDYFNSTGLSERVRKKYDIHLDKLIHYSWSHTYPSDDERRKIYVTEIKKIVERCTNK